MKRLLGYLLPVLLLSMLMVGCGVTKKQVEDLTSPPDPIIKGVSPNMIYSSGVTISVQESSGVVCTASIDGVSYNLESYYNTAGYHLLEITATKLSNGTFATGTLNFTIDPSIPAPPVITGVVDGGVYATDQTITVALDPSTNYTAKIDGSDYTWNTLYSAADGDYALVVTAVRVSNNLTTVTTYNFTYDSVAPAPPEVTGVSEGVTYNSAMTISVNAVAGVTYSATIDTVPYDLGSTTAVTGSLQLVVTAHKNNGLTSSTIINFWIDDQYPAPPVVNGIVDGGAYTSKVISVVEDEGVSYNMWLNGELLSLLSVAGNIGDVTPNATDGVYQLVVQKTKQSNGLSITSTYNFIIDTTAPSGYSVSFDPAAITKNNQYDFDFTFAGAEVGATYYAVLTSDGVGGAASVSNQGTISKSDHKHTGYAADALADGTLTLTVYLKDSLDNQGGNVIARVSKDATEPVFTSVDDNGGDNSYTSGETIIFDLNMGDPGLLVVTDLSVINSGFSSNQALVDDGDGTYSFTTLDVDNGNNMLEGSVNIEFTAVDSFGNTATDNSLVLQLDKTAPLAGNSGTLTVSSVSKNSVELSWSKASDALTSTANLEYLVYYSTADNINSVNDAQDNGIAFGSYTADISSVNVPGLTLGVTYNFNVVVRDQVGNKAAYSTVAARTIIQLSSFTYITRNITMAQDIDFPTAKRLSNGNYVMLKRPYFRIYDQDGVQVGSQISYNTFSHNYGISIFSVLSDDDFVIMYRSYDAPYYYFATERFNSDGSDHERGVTISAAHNSITSSKAVPYDTADGNYGLFYGLGSTYYTRNYNGSAFSTTVNHGSTGSNANHDDYSAITLSNGNIATTWMDYATNSGDVYYAVFNPNQTTVNNAAIVNETIAGAQYPFEDKPMLALSDDKFVVGCRDSSGLMIRVFNNDGSAHTSEITVADTSAWVYNGSLIEIESGVFAVFWTEDNDFVLKGMIFNSDGVVICPKTELFSIKDSDAADTHPWYTIDKESDGVYRIIYESGQESEA